MSRSLRYLPAPGTLVEVTTRTVHGRLLLKPTPLCQCSVRHEISQD
jgi:hypothetical protein